MLNTGVFYTIRIVQSRSGSRMRTYCAVQYCTREEEEEERPRFSPLHNSHYLPRPRQRSSIAVIFRPSPHNFISSCVVVYPFTTPSRTHPKTLRTHTHARARPLLVGVHTRHLVSRLCPPPPTISATAARPAQAAVRNIFLLLSFLRRAAGTPSQDDRSSSVPLYNSE